MLNVLLLMVLNRNGLMVVLNLRRRAINRRPRVCFGSRKIKKFNRFKLACSFVGLKNKFKVVLFPQQPIHCITKLRILFFKFFYILQKYKQKTFVYSVFTI
ncbi:Bov1.b4 [Bovine gammaherpesvirus 6]|uniref:Bov1.b4 n=1 Tax=Bovine gammaherpesvirus 6 TaxID=1504288 RepID=A0A060D3K1_9GAMA|nr:Bov1.b4 [Bovine gammaherpesvirus 6]AIB03155.1 Bov1.b4 [Bovine gammaherpesvirus 6]